MDYSTYKEFFNSNVSNVKVVPEISAFIQNRQLHNVSIDSHKVAGQQMFTANVSS